VNYSQVGIANLALQNIGARGSIQSLAEGSPNANKVNVAWDIVFQEVLSERDWKFAKTRVELQQNANKPVGGYCYAYPLPSDFLRLCRPREIPEERRIADGNFLWGWGGSGFGWFRDRDIPLWPREVHPYITETVLNPAPLDPTYSTNLLTNYPFLASYTSSRPIVINYIRLITDMTQLFPGFVTALTFRLSAALAIAVTEDMKKFESMMAMYQQFLNSAQAQQEVDDYLQDEAGSSTWVDAGRYRRGYY
jgi:hypothetical protein